MTKGRRVFGERETGIAHSRHFTAGAEDGEVDVIWHPAQGEGVLNVIRWFDKGRPAYLQAMYSFDAESGGYSWDMLQGNPSATFLRRGEQINAKVLFEASSRAVDFPEVIPEDVWAQFLEDVESGQEATIWTEV